MEAKKVEEEHITVYKDRVIVKPVIKKEDKYVVIENLVIEHQS